MIRAARKDGEECTVTVSWRCVWHKFTVIKGLIEGKCRSDVQSFNIAFLEGMREHLVEKHVQTSSRRPSSRGGRRKSREGPLPGSSRRRYPSFDKQHEAEDEGRERSTSAFADSEVSDFGFPESDHYAGFEGVVVRVALRWMGTEIKLSQTGVHLFP